MECIVNKLKEAVNDNGLKIFCELINGWANNSNALIESYGNSLLFEVKQGDILEFQKRSTVDFVRLIHYIRRQNNGRFYTE